MEPFEMEPMEPVEQVELNKFFDGNLDTFRNQFEDESRIFGNNLYLENAQNDLVEDKFNELYEVKEENQEENGEEEEKAEIQEENQESYGQGENEKTNNGDKKKREIKKDKMGRPSNSSREERILGGKYETSDSLNDLKNKLVDHFKERYKISEEGIQLLSDRFEQANSAKDVLEALRSFKMKACKKNCLFVLLDEIVYFDTKLKGIRRKNRQEMLKKLGQNEPKPLFWDDYINSLNNNTLKDNAKSGKHRLKNITDFFGLSDDAQNEYLKTQKDAVLFMEHIQDNFLKSWLPRLLNSPVDVRFYSTNGVLNFASLLVNMGLIHKEKENDDSKASDKLPEWLDKEELLKSLNDFCDLLVEQKIIKEGYQRFCRDFSWTKSSDWLSAKLGKLLDISNKNNKEAIRSACKDIVNDNIKNWGNFLLELNKFDFSTRCKWAKKLAPKLKTSLNVFLLIGKFPEGQYKTASKFLFDFLPVLNGVKNELSCRENEEEVGYPMYIFFTTKKLIGGINPQKQFLQLFFSTVEESKKSKLINSILNMLADKECPKRFNSGFNVEKVQKLDGYSEFEKIFNEVSKTKGENNIQEIDEQNDSKPNKINKFGEQNSKEQQTSKIKTKELMKNNKEHKFDSSIKENLIDIKNDIGESEKSESDSDSSYRSEDEVKKQKKEQKNRNLKRQKIKKGQENKEDIEQLQKKKRKRTPGKKAEVGSKKKAEIKTNNKTINGSKVNIGRLRTTGTKNSFSNMFNNSNNDADKNLSKNVFSINK